uniref:Dymeclin n=1 Tax=Dermatophagoides pteronyssinus TaxID=6956 RepID=A0A6P6XLV4_DERPT|nr:dymeclin-like [Dermatophagoides pteronyssinus]
MGTNLSSLKTIKQNDYINRLISNEHINPNDTKFWNEFLSFAFTNLDAICSDSNFMNENVIPLISKWLDNNQTSQNLGSIIQVFIQKVDILKKNSQKNNNVNNNIVIWHAYNLSFIMRNMFKYMIETYTEENVIKQCKLNHSLNGMTTNTNVKAENQQQDENNNGTIMIEHLINALIEILVDLKLDDMNYNLHVESCKNFLVLLSVQMFLSRPSMKSVIYTIVMQRKCSIHALLLTKTLLQNFIQQLPAPIPPTGSIIFGLANGLWNALTLGYGGKKTDEDLIKEAILARESLLLLLVLTNHCTKDINPYREALFQCCDSSIELQSASTTTTTLTTNNEQNITGFKIDFGKLYRTLCQTLNDDQTTLLLYMLLHQNGHFKTFVLSRTTDLDQFLIPVLRILYNSPDRNSHHIYMSLIILLVLSEDNLYNSIIHDITIRNITWYTERNLTEISLGGLIILIIVRTIHFNMSRNRDRFLHTNLCATLANMSNHFKHLHNFVCQKMIALFEKISKKYFKLQQQQLKMQNGIDGNHHQITSNSGGENTTATTTITKSDVDTGEQSSSLIDDLKDITLFEEVLRTILEIINASLTKNMIANPNLIYTLLYNRKKFEPFLNQPLFQDIIGNIDTILTYFSQRIDSVQQTDRQLSVEEIFELIKQASLNWPKEKMKKFPELMFRYVEDDSPEDFFIPYIWSLVYRCSDIYWNSQNILLFNPVRNL